MKRVYILHGWEGSPNSNWFPWLKDKIESYNADTSVTLLAMPNPNYPVCTEWVSHLAQAVGIPDESTYLIGHSLGVITILRYLEQLKDARIGGAILVAGFPGSIGYQELDSFTTTPLNFEKINSVCAQFVVIDSDSDAYVPLSNGDILEKELHASRLTMHNAGHLNADDGYTEFPEIFDVYVHMSSK